MQEPQDHQPHAVGDVLLRIRRLFEKFRKVLVLGHLPEIVLLGENVADVFLVGVVSGVLHFGYPVALEGDGRGLFPDVPEHGQEFAEGVGLAADELGQFLELRVDLPGLVDLHGLGGVLDDVQAVVHRHGDGREVRAVQGAQQTEGKLLAELGQESVTLRLAGLDFPLAHFPLFGIVRRQHPYQGVGRLAKEVRLAREDRRQVMPDGEKMA